MGHFMFFLAVVAACLLWSATFVAAAARTRRTWLRRLLVAVGLVVPPVALLPWVGLTAGLGLMRLETNWFAPTVTVFLAAIVGGLWIALGGLSREASGRIAASAWPIVGLAAMFVMAKAVTFGTLLFIDNAVAAEGRALRVEAAQLMTANLPAPPAAEDDAAPIYLRALKAIEADATLHAEGSPLREPCTADVTSPAVADLLARHAATLELARRAADKPGCRFVRDWSRPSFEMLLPEIQGMRAVGSLLALAARREAADGDAASAIRDIVRVHRVAMHAAAEPMLVSGLVGQAIDTAALQSLASVLPAIRKDDLPLLDDDAFRDFLETPLSYRRHFLGEEAFGLAMLADLAEDPRGRSTLEVIRGLNDAPPPAFFLDAPMSLLFRCFMLPADVAGYRDVMRRFQGVADSVAGPSSKTFADVERETGEIETMLRDRRAGIFSAMIAPALSGVLRSEMRGRAMHGAAAVLVAATRERLASGSLPESVGDLVPARLAEVPRDPFTADGPLLSKRADGRLVVYSVGADREDDGGPSPPGSPAVQGNDDVGLLMPLAGP